MNRAWLIAGVCGLSVAMGSMPTARAVEPPATPSVPASAGQPGGADGKGAKAADAKKIYDESADASQQIAAALAKAKKENRRVLIQWGGNWCPWCIRLHELYKSDEAISQTLLYEYDVVLVDAGRPKGKNIELAKSYGADLAKNGFPFLTVLDADGKPIANQETEALEAKNESGKSAGIAAGHDPKAVLKFLTDHKAQYQSAESLVASGIGEARQTGKLAFVHFGAPTCGWCRRLESWMAKPEVAAILSKAFVDVKVDIERTVGGQEILDQYAHGKNGGIPWFVFITGESQPIADSNGAKGNVGFPAAPEEIEHFGAMLKKTGKLSDAEVTTLLDSLKAAAPKRASTGGA